MYDPGEFQSSTENTNLKDFSNFKVVQVNLSEMMQSTRRLIDEQAIQ